MLIIEKSIKPLAVQSKTKILTDTYGIILAAGSGRRMEDFILQYYGCRHPKQYVAFTGEVSMIQQTLWRTESLIPQQNILVVVDPKHGDFIENQLKDHPPERVIFQPSNRETAPGVLLPLANIYKNNPESTVAIFPADHFVLEEDRFMEHVRLATEAVQLMPEQIILLGIQPDAPENEYGWIQPGKQILRSDGMDICQVKGFHEKPEAETAKDFYNQDYLWNTMVIVSRCSTLWNLALDALPELRNPFENILNALGTRQEQQVIHKEYETMGRATISHGVFEKYPSRLLVVRVDDVIWSDWGNGPRVLDTFKKIGRLFTNFQENLKVI